MRNLFFFTHHYPFTESAEAFIENEIPIAAKCFDHIYIVPLTSDKTVRAIPQNATIIQPPFSSSSDILRQGLKGLSPRVAYLLIKEFFHLKRKKTELSLRSFLIQSLILSALQRSRQLKEVEQLVAPDDILYCYWGIGWANVIPFIGSLKNKFYVRFHRGDLYTESGSALLFRESLLRRVTRAIFISRQGENYQHNHYPDIDFKSEVSYLGTTDVGVAPRSSDGKLRILSCSTIKPVKRVDLIFRSLVELNDPNVEWTHIGGQVEALECLQDQISSTPHCFKVNLLGIMPNKEVLNWISSNPVDMFINVSSSEGLPVSIMEAISFNIPVVATNVGGTSEIVTSETGILISPNPTPKEVANAISTLRNVELSPRKNWLKNFYAETNYKKFYNSL